MFRACSGEFIAKVPEEVKHFKYIAMSVSKLNYNLLVFYFSSFKFQFDLVSNICCLDPGHDLTM